MTRTAQLVLGAGLFLCGVLAGVYVQHRWPVGRWGKEIAPTLAAPAADPGQIARLPSNRRLVLLLAGQSNAANYGSVLADAGPGVYAWHDGKLLPARDPLPGADQHRGSPWTRLAAMLMLTKRYDAVVLVAIAQGGTYAADWAPGGSWHGRLQQTLRDLQQAELPPDFILWQQGESEGGTPGAAGQDYLTTMTALLESTRSLAPHARWVIARATYSDHHLGNAQIREAQRLAASLPGAHPGPDLDILDGPYRSDGVHFNGRGLDAAAALWRDSLDPLLVERTAP